MATWTAFASAKPTRPSDRAPPAIARIISEHGDETQIETDSQARLAARAAEEARIAALPTPPDTMRKKAREANDPSGRGRPDAARFPGSRLHRAFDVDDGEVGDEPGRAERARRAPRPRRRSGISPIGGEARGWHHRERRRRRTARGPLWGTGGTAGGPGAGFCQLMRCVVVAFGRGPRHRRGIPPPCYSPRSKPAKTYEFQQ